MRNSKLLALGLASLLVASTSASAETLDPVAQFATLDADGDGVYESLRTADTTGFEYSVNPGLPMNGRLAHVEYDLGAFAGKPIASIELLVAFYTNNHFHQTRETSDHDRTFDINLYVGNGNIDLSDADQAGNPNVARVTYRNTAEIGKEFTLDITDEATALLGPITPTTYLGVSAVGVETHGGGWGPSLFWGHDRVENPQLVVVAVPEPSAALLATAALVFPSRRRRRAESR